MRNVNQDPRRPARPDWEVSPDQAVADESGGWLWLQIDGSVADIPVEPPFDEPAMTPLTPPGYTRDHAAG